MLILHAYIVYIVMHTSHSKEVTVKLIYFYSLLVLMLVLLRGGYIGQQLQL